MKMAAALTNEIEDDIPADVDVPDDGDVPVDDNIPGDDDVLADVDISVNDEVGAHLGESMFQGEEAAIPAKVICSSTLTTSQSKAAYKQGRQETG